MFCGWHWISRSFTFQKDWKRFKEITSRESRLSLFFFSLSSSFLSVYLAISHFLLLSLESMRGRGLLLKGERAKKIATSARRTHIHPDIFIQTRVIHRICDNSYACHIHIYIYIHTYMRTRIVAFIGISPLLFEALMKKWAKVSPLFILFVASSLWDGPRRYGSSNTCVFILRSGLHEIQMSHKFHIFN